MPYVRHQAYRTLLLQRCSPITPTRHRVVIAPGRRDLPRQESCSPGRLTSKVGGAVVCVSPESPSACPVAPACRGPPKLKPTARRRARRVLATTGAAGRLGGAARRPRGGAPRARRPSRNRRRVACSDQPSTAHEPRSGVGALFVRHLHWPTAVAAGRAQPGVGRGSRRGSWVVLRDPGGDAGARSFANGPSPSSAEQTTAPTSLCGTRLGSSDHCISSARGGVETSTHGASRAARSATW
jgi:hypothetical protein